MNKSRLIALTDRFNPILTQDLIFKRYDSLKRRVSVAFTAEEYANFCVMNEMRRGDSIFVIDNCDSPKTLHDLRIARGGFRGETELEFKQIKQRYERLVKKHGEKNIRFTLAEFKRYCENNSVKSCDAFYTPKKGRKIFLDDLILKRNVRVTSSRWLA